MADRLIPAELLRQLPQLCQIDRIYVGAGGAQGEGRHHLILRRLLHRLAYGGGIKLEFVDGAAMGERVDPGHPIGPAHDLGDAAAVSHALQRVGQRLALEALRVRQHVADGAPGQRRVIERQHDIRPQHAFALADDDLSGGVLRHAGARDELQSLRLDERLARLCHLRRQPLALPGFEFIEPRPLDDRQWRAHRHRVERHPVNGDRAAAGLVLLQRRHQDRPALEHQAFRPADHPVDDGAFQQGAAGADHHPAKPGQPAAVVQRPQETLASAPSFDRDIDVDPVRSRQRCPGIGARQSGAGGAPRHPRHVAQGRQHRQQRRPEATALLQLGRDAGRHRLAVIVQQRKRRAVIDDVGAGACDDVRPRRAIDQSSWWRPRPCPAGPRAGCRARAPVTASGLRSTRRARQRRQP